MPEVRIAHNSKRLLGYSNQPYQREITWDGSYSDWYLVDVNSGDRRSCSPAMVRGRHLPVGSAVGLVCRQALALTYGGNEQNEESYGGFRCAILQRRS